MTDSPIESTKELHESKERKPEPSQRTENYVRNSDQLLVKAAPSMGWRGWMKVYLPDGDAYRVIGEEFDRDFTRVGLSRGAEPEPLPPRGEAETPTDWNTHTEYKASCNQGVIAGSEEEAKRLACESVRRRSFTSDVEILRCVVERNESRLAPTEADYARLAEEK